MKQEVYTRSEVLAALRQAGLDMDGLPETGPFPTSDKEKLTAHVALAECANYLGISNDEFRNYIPIDGPGPHEHKN